MNPVWPDEAGIEILLFLGVQSWTAGRPWTGNGGQKTEDRHDTPIMFSAIRPRARGHPPSPTGLWRGGQRVGDAPGLLPRM